jgi:HemY protein
MWRVIWFLGLAVILVAFAWWLFLLPGTVSVSLGSLSIETSTSIAILGLIVLVVLLYAVVRVLAWVFTTHLRVGAWGGRRRRRQGDVAVTRTLVAIAAGEAGSAVREAARARKLLGDTPQTLLLAAEAERLADREDGAAAYYQKLAATKDGALLGLRGLFRQAMTKEDWSSAAEIAKRAEQVHPAGGWLRDERAQLAVRTGNWAEALRLSAPGISRAALATAAAQAEPDASAALRLAKQAWKEAPTFAPAAIAYAQRLRAMGREVKAFDVVRDAWKANPQPELAAFWLGPIEDAPTRLREAGRLVAGNPTHPEAYFLLARACLDADLPGEARHQLELARQGGLNQRRVWLLLADLAAAERDESETGRVAQRDALRRAAAAEPDSGWHCEVCGVEQAAWLPACPVCHTTGRISWGPKRLALAAS